MIDSTDQDINSKNKPQETETAPQGTATAPQGTATAPQGTDTPPQGTASAPTEGGPVYSGSQADIVVQKGKVLKVYKTGSGFNANVLPLVKKLRDQGFVVALFDFGTMDYEGEQRQFELMEYCPEGAVSAVNLKGNKTAILAIVRKVAEALDACHQTGFIHKDVKPANILIRDKSTWDCALCDFGIADVLDHGKVVTGQARTPIYAAPEVYERTVTIGRDTFCELTPAADFYSLGMTILCMWYGESAFRSQEKTMAVKKVHDGIVVPTDMPDPLYTITRGLLVKDPAHRWGWKEINDFLNGAKVEVYNEQQQGGLNITFNSSKKQVAHSVQELAEFMVGDMSLAIKYLYSGKVSKWLEHMPELQIEIENIVEKEFPRNQQMGLIAAIHTLNPFYDLNLCCDIDDPAYAMTGVTLGNVLNQAYDHYFTQNDADPLATRIVESFLNGSDTDYVPWFLDHKGTRFAQQRKWFDYCVKGDRKNSKKAGPKDANYLLQVAMMKTIAGFGAQPEYRLSRTGEVLKSIDDVYKAPKEELLYDLQNDKGIKGWLAVLCHEDPNADLKKKYTYEKLLEQYIQLIGYIDPIDQAFTRFNHAQKDVKAIAAKANNAVNDTQSLLTTQKVVAILFGVIPLGILLVEIILNIIDNPSVKLGRWTDWVFYGAGALAAIISFFALDQDGCLLALIIGVAVAFFVSLIIQIIGYTILYLYCFTVIAALVYFSLPILFDVSKKQKTTVHRVNPNFEQLTLEPLYYAFNDEKVFDSSINGITGVKDSSTLRETVKKRWRMVLVFLGVTLLLFLFRFAMPKSERMNRFDHFISHPFNTETTQNDEVQPLSDPQP